ncbi:permease [Parvularcula bermudensis HTCC2503]|uniref:Permease n=1 Tax=Parvularcula bermudensis (strain ATCC BAA-594 / HTCC2503 / KCTC 12087) TaxID=314260 RepID=E0TB46_PARBH|nr:TCR/Tet family MFS transporter [Parvularcula bermudensis]ADM08255.1 permease [Parvularcula bermudensis HTCC2503]
MSAPAPRRALVFIFITVLLSMIGVGIILPVMPALLTDLTGFAEGESARLYGYLMFAYAAMQFLFSPVIGALSDQYGRRPVILVSLFFYGIDFLLMAFVPTFGWLVLGRLLSGATAATFSTAGAFIADVSPPEKRAQNFGIIGAAFGLGFIIGPVLGGLAAAYGPSLAILFPSDSGVASALTAFGPRYPFLLASVVIFANFIFGLTAFPESLPVERRRAFDWRRANPIGGLISVSRNRTVLVIMGAYFLMQVAHHSFPAVWAFYTTAKFGWSALSISLSLSYVGITAAVVQGYLTRKAIPALGETRAVVIGSVAMALSTLGYAFFTPAGPWVYVWITVGALGGFMMPGMQAKMTKATAEDAQGELQGAIASLSSITMAFSPLMMTQIFAAFTDRTEGQDFPGAPYAVASLFLFASGALFLWGARRNRPAPPEPIAAQDAGTA